MPKPPLPLGVVNAAKFIPRRFQHFTYNYSPEYKTFITQHLNLDDAHPLNVIRRRVAREREKTGLWWHVTTDKSTALKRVVRTWVRRRLTNAFTESLKERGFSDAGKLLPVEKRKGYEQSEVLRELEKKEPDVSLTGSVKLHADKSVVSAKYVDLKKETDAMVSGLVQGLEVEARQKLGLPQQRQQHANPPKEGPQRDGNTNAKQSKQAPKPTQASQQATQRATKPTKQTPQKRGLLPREPKNTELKNAGQKNKEPEHKEPKSTPRLSFTSLLPKKPPPKT